MGTSKLIIFNYSTKSLFFLMVFISILIDYLSILFSQNAVPSLLNIFLNLEDGSPVLLFLNSLFSFVFYALWFLILAECIRFVGRLFKKEMELKTVLKVVIIAEIVFSFSDALQLLLGNLFELESELFSLEGLFGSEAFHSSTKYLLSTINIFQILYAMVIVYMLKLEYNLEWILAMKIVLFAYGPIFILSTLLHWIPIMNLPS